MTLLMVCDAVVRASHVPLNTKDEHQAMLEGRPSPVASVGVLASVPVISGVVTERFCCNEVRQCPV